METPHIVSVLINSRLSLLYVSRGCTKFDNELKSSVINTAEENFETMLGVEERTFIKLKTLLDAEVGR